MIVDSYSWAAFCSWSITTCPLPQSRALVGSSAKQNRGRLIRARPIATRCFSPPESWAGFLFSLPFEAEQVRASRRPACGLPARRRRRPSAERSPVAVVRSGPGTRLYPWKMNPQFRSRNCSRSRGLSRQTSTMRPLSRANTCPRSGASRPDRIARSVDFPDPLGPMSRVISPAVQVERHVVDDVPAASPVAEGASRARRTAGSARSSAGTDIWTPFQLDQRSDFSRTIADADR